MSDETKEIFAKWENKNFAEYSEEAQQVYQWINKLNPLEFLENRDSAVEKVVELFDKYDSLSKLSKEETVSLHFTLMYWCTLEPDNPLWKYVWDRFISDLSLLSRRVFGELVETYYDFVEWAEMRREMGPLPHYSDSTLEQLATIFESASYFQYMAEFFNVENMNLLNVFEGDTGEQRQMIEDLFVTDKIKELGHEELVKNHLITDYLYDKAREDDDEAGMEVINEIAAEFNRAHYGYQEKYLKDETGTMLSCYDLIWTVLEWTYAVKGEFEEEDQFTTWLRQKGHVIKDMNILENVEFIYEFFFALQDSYEEYK